MEQYPKQMTSNPVTCLRLYCELGRFKNFPVKGDAKASVRKRLMQEGLTRGWKQIDRRIGSFSGYIVTGIQFQAPDGETGWQISSWPFTDPVHDYWVDGDKFYRMRIDFDVGRTFEIFGEANVDSKEKEAICEAIRTWESPDSGEAS